MSSDTPRCTLCQKVVDDSDDEGSPVWTEDGDLFCAFCWEYMAEVNREVTRRPQGGSVPLPEAATPPPAASLPRPDAAAAAAAAPAAFDQMSSFTTENSRHFPDTFDDSLLQDDEDLLKAPFQHYTRPAPPRSPPRQHPANTAPPPPPPALAGPAAPRFSTPSTPPQKSRTPRTPSLQSLQEGEVEGGVGGDPAASLIYSPSPRHPSRRDVGVAGGVPTQGVPTTPGGGGTAAADMRRHALDETQPSPGNPRTPPLPYGSVEPDRAAASVNDIVTPKERARRRQLQASEVAEFSTYEELFDMYMENFEVIRPPSATPVRRLPSEGAAVPASQRSPRSSQQRVSPPGGWRGSVERHGSMSASASRAGSVFDLHHTPHPAGTPLPHHSAARLTGGRVEAVEYTTITTTSASSSTTRAFHSQRPEVVSKTTWSEYEETGFQLCYPQGDDPQQVDASLIRLEPVDDEEGDPEEGIGFAERAAHSGSGGKSHHDSLVGLLEGVGCPFEAEGEEDDDEDIAGEGLDLGLDDLRGSAPLEVQRVQVVQSLVTREERSRSRSCGRGSSAGASAQPPQRRVSGRFGSPDFPAVPDPSDANTLPRDELDDMETCTASPALRAEEAASMPDTASEGEGGGRHSGGQRQLEVALQFSDADLMQDTARTCPLVESCPPISFNESAIEVLSSRSGVSGGSTLSRAASAVATAESFESDSETPLGLPIQQQHRRRGRGSAALRAVSPSEVSDPETEANCPSEGEGGEEAVLPVRPGGGVGRGGGAVEGVPRRSMSTAPDTIPPTSPILSDPIIALKVAAAVQHALRPENTVASHRTSLAHVHQVSVESAARLRLMCNEELERVQMIEQFDAQLWAHETGSPLPGGQQQQQQEGVSQARPVSPPRMAASPQARPVSPPHTNPLEALSPREPAGAVGPSVPPAPAAAPPVPAPQQQGHVVAPAAQVRQGAAAAQPPRGGGPMVSWASLGVLRIDANTLCVEGIERGSGAESLGLRAGDRLSAIKTDFAAPVQLRSVLDLLEWAEKPVAEFPECLTVCVTRPVSRSQLLTAPKPHLAAVHIPSAFSGVRKVVLKVSLRASGSLPPVKRVTAEELQAAMAQLPWQADEMEATPTQQQPQQRRRTQQASQPQRVAARTAAHPQKGGDAAARERSATSPAKQSSPGTVRWGSEGEGRWRQGGAASGDDAGRQRPAARAEPRQLPVAADHGLQTPHTPSCRCDRCLHVSSWVESGSGTPLKAVLQESPANIPVTPSGAKAPPSGRRDHPAREDRKDSATNTPAGGENTADIALAKQSLGLQGFPRLSHTAAPDEIENFMNGLLKRYGPSSLQ